MQKFHPLNHLSRAKRAMFPPPDSRDISLPVAWRLAIATTREVIAFGRSDGLKLISGYPPSPIEQCFLAITQTLMYTGRLGFRETCSGYRGNSPARFLTFHLVLVERCSVLFETIASNPFIPRAFCYLWKRK